MCAMSAPALQFNELRSFVAVAHVEEVLANPALVEAYARTFGPDDDETLMIYAPDQDEASWAPCSVLSSSSCR